MKPDTLFNEQSRFALQECFPAYPEVEDSHWLCSIRLVGFGYVMDIGGTTKEEAEANAYYVIERLNAP